MTGLSLVPRWFKSTPSSGLGCFSISWIYIHFILAVEMMDVVSTVKKLDEFSFHRRAMRSLAWCSAAGSPPYQASAVPSEGGCGVPSPPGLPWGQDWSMWGSPPCHTATAVAEVGQAEFFHWPYILTGCFCKGKLISWLFPLGSVVGYPGSEGIKWAGPSGIRRHPGGIRYGWYLIQELRFFCFIDLTYLWLYTHNGLHYKCHVDLCSCQ